MCLPAAGPAASSSYGPHHSSVRQAPKQCSLFDRGRHWDKERLSELSYVAQLVNEGLRFELNLPDPRV